MKKNTNSNEQTTKGLRPNPMSERVSSTTNTQKSPQDSSVFGEVIYIYTRRQALREETQFDYSHFAKKCGFKCALYLTSGILIQCVYQNSIARVFGQDNHIKRLFRLARKAMLERQKHNDSGQYAFNHIIVRNGRPEMVRVFVDTGFCDFDDPRPAITLLLEEER